MLLLNTLLLAAFFGIAACGLQTAYQIVQRLQRGEEIVPAVPRREVPWGLLDFCIAFLALATGAVILGLSLRAAFPAELAQQPELPVEGANVAPPQSVILAMTVADSLLKLAVMLAIIPLISWRTGTTAKDWGIDWSQLREDVVLGARAFCVLIPIVFAIQATLVLVFQWPSKHPLIESLKEAPSLSLFAASFIAAVIMAPIAEEWSFRVLLQGWLEKVASRQFSWEQLLLGGSASHEAALVEPLEEDNSDSAATPRSSERLRDNPYLSPSDPFATTSRAGEAVPAAQLPWWPIVASAAIFALVHVSHGPDFVPLFVLSLGLGYLYRQTHRITPSLVVHFGLNLTTMVAIGASLLESK